MKLMRRLTLLFFVLCLLPFALFGQSSDSYLMKGKIVSGEDNTAMAGVTVIIFDADSSDVQTTFSDKNGGFLLADIKPGKYTLLVRSVGFVTYRQDILIEKNIYGKEITLDPDVLEFGNVEVRAEFARDSSLTQTSIQRISATSVQELAGGQGDVINMLKVTPSVTSTSDYSSQLIVRGGDANQNLFYLDDIEIYSPYQANGAGSIFNPSVIRNLDFYSGAFPARYGDRLSSVLVINSTTGNPRSPFNADVTVDATTATATLNGALPFMDGSWIISGRKTYFDSFANTYSKAIVTKNDIAFPDFYDFTGKVQLRPAESHTLSLIGLFNEEIIDWISQEDQFGELETSRSKFLGDQKSANRAFGISWGFNPTSWFQSKVYTNWYRNIGDNGLGGVFRPGVVPRHVSGPGGWESPVGPNDKIAIDYQQNYSFDKYSTGSRIHFDLPRNSVEVGGGIDYLKNNLDVDLGLNAYGDSVFTSFENTAGMLEAIADTIQSNNNNIRYSAYIQDRIEVIKSRLFVRPGLRYSYYGINKEDFLLPRFSLSFTPSNGFTIRAGAGRYVQSPGFEKLIEPDNIFNISKFQDVSGLEAETSVQYVLGLSKVLSDKWKFSVEGYYKTYDKLITNKYELRERLVDVFVPDTHERITTLDPANYTFELQEVYELTDIPINNGEGTSKGLEFMLQKFSHPDDRWSGWFSYVLAKSERTETIQGERITYPFDYDRRHTFNLILNRGLNDKWDVGVSWRYGSGLPYTQPIALKPMTYTFEGEGYFIADFDTELIQMNPDFGGVDNINQKRYDPYNRIDLRIRYKNQAPGFNYFVYLDLINVINNQNVQSYKYVMYIVDPNPEGTDPRFRRPSGAELKKEPIFMYPFIPSLGVNISF